MFDTKKIDELVEKLVDALPPGVKTLKDDLKKNFHAILLATLNKMDLVTREEFDVQVAVLQKTRRKLEQIEKKIAEMEHNKTGKKK